jgi:hypothetical protein
MVRICSYLVFRSTCIIAIEIQYSDAENLPDPPLQSLVESIEQDQRNPAQMGESILSLVSHQSVSGGDQELLALA